MELSRRQFLAGSAGLALLPRFQSPIILGSGEHRYACIHDWIKPPEGMAFGDTHGVAQDGRGRIYVAHTVHETSKNQDTIAVYDERGKFLNSWGSQFKGGAHGLDLRREGGEEFLYHCDVAHRKVTKTRLDGSVVWELGAPVESGKYRAGEAYIPTNVAFAPDGEFFVADGYGSHWIHRYRADGTYLRTFGGPGKEAGQVQQPHGIWLDDRGKQPLLAVADRANRRIQYFDLDGKHVSFIENGMRLPCHFSIRRGVMLVPDLQSVITLLDPENRVIAHLGDGDPSAMRGRPRAE
jgi:sugar lactone lactonase YvrE